MKKNNCYFYILIINNSANELLLILIFCFMQRLKILDKSFGLFLATVLVTLFGISANAQNIQGTVANC